MMPLPLPHSWVTSGQVNSESQISTSKISPCHTPAIATFAESKGVGMGKAAQPLRVALTGAAVSPPLGISLALVGRAPTLARLARCIEHHHGEV